jgi:hypothetical protein
MERRMVRIWSAGDQLPVMIRNCVQGICLLDLTLEDIETDAA